MTRPLRLAFFSPLPPARTGIADYSRQLLPHLRTQTEITLFSAEPDKVDAELRHQFGIGQTRTGVFRSVTGDITGGLNGLANRLGIQIGGARTSLVLPDVNTDTEAIVLLVLDGLDLTHARRYRKPLRNRQSGLGLGSAIGFSQFQGFSDDVFE